MKFRWVEVRKHWTRSHECMIEQIVLGNIREAIGSVEIKN
jgi:hypothetical protein